MPRFYAKSTPYGGTRGRASAYSKLTAGKRSYALASKRYVLPAGKPFRPRLSRSSLASRVRALVAGKTKDSATTWRAGTFTATTVSCLTSSIDFAVATGNSGLIATDADSALINSVTVRQSIELQCREDLTPVALSAACIRTLIVWFYEPLLAASAAGTLPPITEVLEADAVNALVVPDTRNAGRFTILYDKTVCLGSNTVAVAASGADARLNGMTVLNEEFTVKVGKQVHFAEPAVAGGADQGGHYDSDELIGLVRKGLLIMYTVGINQATAGTTVIDRNTRINYTA